MGPLASSFVNDSVIGPCRIFAESRQILPMKVIFAKITLVLLAQLLRHRSSFSMNGVVNLATSVAGNENAGLNHVHSLEGGVGSGCSGPSWPTRANQWQADSPCEYRLGCFFRRPRDGAGAHPCWVERAYRSRLGGSFLITVSSRLKRSCTPLSEMRTA